MKKNENEARLTVREKEIMNYLAEGFLYKEIAGKTSISIETVKKHTKNIYKKLNARNRTEAMNRFLN